MNYSFYSLSDLIDTLGESSVGKYLSTYSDRFITDAEQFLHEKAIIMEKKALSRTYLAISSEGEILGFASVGIKCLKIASNNRLSKNTLKDLNIDSSTGVAQCYLLGQLSRSANSPSGFGKVILRHATERISVAMGAVGCRYVRLDCIPELIPYYESLGFKLIEEPKDGSLNKMLIKLGAEKLGPKAH